MRLNEGSTKKEKGKSRRQTPLLEDGEHSVKAQASQPNSFHCSVSSTVFFTVGSQWYASKLLLMRVREITQDLETPDLAEELT